MFTTTFRNGSEQSYRYIRSVDGRETWTPRVSRSSFNQSTERTMVSRFDGTCRTCGARFSAGTEIVWSKAAGSKHTTCPKPVEQAAKSVSVNEMSEDDAAMALAEMAADREQSMREAKDAADLDIADEADALLERYHAAIDAQLEETRREHGVGGTMSHDELAAVWSEQAARRLNSPSKGLTEEQIATQADALLAEYDQERRAKNVAALQVGTYRVEFSGKSDTDSFNLKVTKDKIEGAFRFKQAESWDGAGRVFADGRIQLWNQTNLTADEQKRAQEALEILLGAERMGAYGEAYARATGTCFRCGRELKVEDSIDRGLGKTCAQKVEMGY
jgi:hypothetical protein